MSLSLACHCEERSDVAIRSILRNGFSRLLAQAQNDRGSNLNDIGENPSFLLLAAITALVFFCIV